MTQISPLQQYQIDIENNVVSHDDAQYKVLTELETLYHQLIQRQHVRNTTLGENAPKRLPTQADYWHLPLGKSWNRKNLHDGPFL